MWKGGWRGVVVVVGVVGERRAWCMVGRGRCGEDCPRGPDE